MASYQDIVEGLQDCLETVATLEAVLAYVPTSVGSTPMVYLLLDSATTARSGQVLAIRYRVLARLVVLWQDNEQAELEVMPLVSSIIDAVEADPHLGGALKAGYAQIDEIDAGWDEIGGVTYRVVDFYADVLAK